MPAVSCVPVSGIGSIKEGPNGSFENSIDMTSLAVSACADGEKWGREDMSKSSPRGRGIKAAREFVCKQRLDDGHMGYQAYRCNVATVVVARVGTLVGAWSGGQDQRGTWVQGVDWFV